MWLYCSPVMTHLSSCLTSKFWVSVSFASQESNWFPQQPPHLLTRVQRGKKKILGSLGSYVGTTFNEGLQTACSAILLFLRSPLSPILPERSFGLNKRLLSGYRKLVSFPFHWTPTRIGGSIGSTAWARFETCYTRNASSSIVTLLY